MYNIYICMNAGTGPRGTYIRTAAAAASTKRPMASEIERERIYIYKERDDKE